MIGALEAKLFHRVVIEPRTGINVENAPMYGPAVTESAWVSSTVKMIRTKDGTEAVSTAQIMLRPTTTATEDSRYTLPDGRQPKVLRFNTVPDPRSGTTDHVTVYLE